MPPRLPARKRIRTAARELKENPPSRPIRSEAERRAIAINKARKAEREARKRRRS